MKNIDKKSKDSGKLSVKSDKKTSASNSKEVLPVKKLSSHKKPESAVFQEIDILVSEAAANPASSDNQADRTISSDKTAAKLLEEKLNAGELTDADEIDNDFMTKFDRYKKRNIKRISPEPILIPAIDKKDIDMPEHTGEQPETFNSIESELRNKFDRNRRRRLKNIEPEPIFIPTIEKKEPSPELTELHEALNKPRRQLFTPARIIAFGMLLIIFMGAFLLSLPISSKSGSWTGFSDSLFTSCSAVCVTGLVVLDTGAYFSIFGQIVLILLMQLGGLGFMAAATMLFFLIKKRITLKNRLAMQEALNQDTAGGTVRLMKHVIILTFLIEGIGALILMPMFIIDFGAKGILDSIFVSVSAFCNAGFENISTSSMPFPNISAYSGNALILITISMLTVLGGIGFAVLGDIFKHKRFSKLSAHTKLVLITTGILLCVSVVFFLIAEYNNVNTIGNKNFGNKLISVIMHSAAARTSGFTTFDQNSMNLVSQLFTIILMFIGASPASTGGGIKTTTLSILFLIVIAGLRSSNEVTFKKQTLSRRAGFRAVSVLLYALSTVLLMTMLLMLTEQNNPDAQPYYSLTGLMFEVVSAFSTCGLSMGITPHLTHAGRVFIMITMFLGRVGPITIGLLFLKRAGATQIKYPEANIMIG